MRMTRARATAGLAAVALAATAVTAEAAIPMAKARATAYKAAVAAARQTHGYSPQVLSCVAKTGRRDLCKVKVRYRTGAKSCVIEVTVQYASRTSSRLVYRFGQTLCS